MSLNKLILKDPELVKKINDLILANHNWTPLPSGFRIENSNIARQGLFTERNLEASTVIGVTHRYREGAPNNMDRTCLGGFINHSLDNNCVLRKECNTLVLYTIRDISSWEEITLNYAETPCLTFCKF